MSIQFVVDTDTCVQCGECVADCLVRALEMGADGPEMSAQGAARCIRCQHCLAICPTGAVSILGRSPEQSEEFAGRLPSPESVLLLMRARRSVRRYLPEAVAPEQLDMLMESLAGAPTGVNNQGLLFHVVRDPAVMERIRQDTRTATQNALAQPGKGGIPERLLSYFEAFAAGEDTVFRGAPHMLVVSVRKDSPCAFADPFIALSYFELLAASMGLGAVWCGVAMQALFHIFPELGARVGIPADHQPGYVMMFGKTGVRYQRTVERGPANTREIAW